MSKSISNENYICSKDECLNLISSVIESTALSPETLGVYVQLLFYTSDNHQVRSCRQFAKIAHTGMGRATRLIAELKSMGLVSTETKARRNGRFSGGDIRPVPLSEAFPKIIETSN